MASKQLMYAIRSSLQSNPKRCMSHASKLTNAEIHRKRTEMFGKEKARQKALVSRIEKIQVEHKGPPEDCSLIMNKGLSTPFNCAMHINELLMMRSVVALVDGKPWDMHRPLEGDCELRFLHFKDEDPALPNETFWRSGSFILGYVLENAFKDDFYVELCSFPRPNVRSGSFVYDVDLKLPEWKPSVAELNCMSRVGMQLKDQDLQFERLEVDASLALTMFEDNRFKTAQLPVIAAQSPTQSSVTLYRLGNHVDVSRGPLMSSPNLINRFAICAVHKIESPDFGPLQRVQALAIPKQLPMHYWSYELLCERAAKPNPALVPTLPSSQTVHKQQQLENS